MGDQQVRIEVTEVTEKKRIGLALSGGGFRASIFHLGVIKRLEELKIMEEVQVISCVSGGSIVGAFYVLEMEKRLNAQSSISTGKAKTRLELFDEIAADFIVQLKKNIRTRGMLYAPFFHPFLWVKSLLPGNSRMDILVREYDKCFFDHAALNEFPSSDMDREKNCRYKGTKLILNTTSLQDGRRISYFRRPVIEYMEMIKVNQNFERVSVVVAASSAVPGVIPPIRVGKELLVDGGVSDNQGILPFIGYESGQSGNGDGSHASSHSPCPGEKLYHHPMEECDALIVSDASGQMEEKRSPGTFPLAVLSRSANIQGFQIRNRNIDLLICWKRMRNHRREFAFIHLFRDLKDKACFTGRNRVPSEYVPALGRIRTDLDQFSDIEIEALMYHGYTLIDYQLRSWCQILLKSMKLTKGGLPGKGIPCPLQDEYRIKETPPLFDESTELDVVKRRSKIRKHLEAGKHNWLFVRAWKNYKVLAIFAVVLFLGLFFGFYWKIYPLISNFVDDNMVTGYIMPCLTALVPEWLRSVYGLAVEHKYFAPPLTAVGTVRLILAALVAYVSAFFTYLLLHFSYPWLVGLTYKMITGSREPYGFKAGEDGERIT